MVGADLKAKTAAAKKTAQAKAAGGGKNKNFFKSTINELKKVHWPTKKLVAKYTGVVLAAVIVMAAALWCVDTVLSLGLNAIIK